MMNLLVLKERLKIFYQKTELYLLPIIKFVTAFIVFLLINQSIGFDGRLKKIIVVLALSLLSAFTPTSILVMLAAALSIGHIYAISKILSIIIILIMFILYFLFVKFTPKYGYVVLAIPILFILKIPYVIPILLGLVATPITIIPVSCGVVIYYMFDIMKEAVTITSNTNLDDTLTLYKSVIDSLIHNKLMILTLVAFAAVILVTYFVRKMKFDHAPTTAIAAGAITNVLVFLIGDLIIDVSGNIFIMIIGTIIGALLAFVIQFFILSLDYTAVENVQFEDDDYYYYVKAVPKMSVTTPKKDIKRINVQKSTGNTMNLQSVDNTIDHSDVNDTMSDSERYELDEMDFDEKY